MKTIAMDMNRLIKEHDLLLTLEEIIQRLRSLRHCYLDKGIALKHEALSNWDLSCS